MLKFHLQRTRELLPLPEQLPVLLLAALLHVVLCLRQLVAHALHHLLLVLCDCLAAIAIDNN